ncbi:hypothetical protein B0W44_16880 [Novibacillus thermophilus]|uniref:Uncharacterized protein n=1 Tax=Novibacillus thermophilus TaxID=1471761 RepID=A0A1U9KB12_9BACL|nr:hypothetical protein B0W44_16880 [Novibacillus thermophilus]
MFCETDVYVRTTRGVQCVFHRAVERLVDEFASVGTYFRLLRLLEVRFSVTAWAGAATSDAQAVLSVFTAVRR